jgi:hypothetical protein
MRGVGEGEKLMNFIKSNFEYAPESSLVTTDIHASALCLIAGVLPTSQVGVSFL